MKRSKNEEEQEGQDGRRRFGREEKWREDGERTREREDGDAATTTTKEQGTRNKESEKVTLTYLRGESSRGRQVRLLSSRADD